MEDGSIVLCRRFVSKMLMRVVPGARGAHMYSTVVRSWRDRMMLWRPGGWQQRVSLLKMNVLLKLVVSHRWYVLMAILDSDTRWCRMSARSPRGPPRVFRIVSLPPHTCWMIDGMRASDPRKRRVQWASVHGQGLADHRWTCCGWPGGGWRSLQIQQGACSTEQSHCLCPSLPVPMSSWGESSPRMRWANILNSTSMILSALENKSSLQDRMVSLATQNKITDKEIWQSLL